MKLTFFDAETLPLETGGGIAEDAWIVFSVKTGKITLSPEAAALIGVADGGKIALAQNDEHPHPWYIFKDKDGFELRAMKSGKLCLTHAELVTTFLDSHDKAEEIAHKVYLSGEPKKVARRAYWQLNFLNGETPATSDDE
jgi:hypothetical protein